MGNQNLQERIELLQAFLHDGLVHFTVRSGSKPATTPFEPTEHPTTALGTVEHTTISLRASATTERHDRDEQIEALHDQTLLVSWPGSPLAWHAAVSAIECESE
jgi:hypothetical protein